MAAPDDELRALRERAYGPDADIDDDPAALARLRELESAQAVPDAAPPAPLVRFDDPAPATAEDVPTSDPPATDAAADDPAPEPGSEEPAPPGGRLPRRTIWLWAGSVALALVVGAAATMATSSVMGNRVAVLGEADVSQWPAGMFGEPQEGARVFETFHGIRVIVVPNVWGAPGSDITCMFVVRADGEGGTQPPNEILTTGCGDPAFAPTASFSVTEASPDALLEQFTVGTGVRVVLAGDEVHVFARTP